MNTTIDGPTFLDAVSDDSAFTTRANGGEFLNGTFKRIEDMVLAFNFNREAFVVAISTLFTFGHNSVPQRIFA